MMTGESIISFGKYKLNRLKNLPRNYLLALYSNKSLDKNILDYIQENMDEIKTRGDFLIIETKVYSPRETRKKIVGCSKLGYINKKEANFALRGIRENPKTDKVPIRSYECEICGAWHHTSLETFNPNR